MTDAMGRYQQDVRSRLTRPASQPSQYGLWAVIAAHHAWRTEVSFTKPPFKPKRSFGLPRTPQDSGNENVIVVTDCFCHLNTGQQPPHIIDR